VPTRGTAPVDGIVQIEDKKMKTCNADASKQQLKGDDRKKFMSTCLKAS
jgi:hypothetical protein